MRFPHIGLYHPYAPQVLLDHVVELIIGFEHPFKNRMRPGHDQIQAHGQQRNGCQEDDGDVRVDFQHHHQGKQEHQRATDSDPDDHLKSVLDIGHVCGQSGNQAGCGKPVDIRKGIVLYRIIHITPQVFRKACGCTGGKMTGQGAEHQGKQTANR